MPEAVAFMAEGHGCLTHYKGNVKVIHFPITLCRLISEDEDKNFPYYSSQCSPPASTCFFGFVFVFFFFMSFIVKRGVGVELREGFLVYDDDCDNNHYHP